MTIIRIQEQAGAVQPEAALLIFDHGVQYEIAVHDPFADNSRKEEDLEWYFEDHLTYPFLEQVRARKAAQSIRTYGEALFKQLFTDAQALGMYREACLHGLHTFQIEVAGSPAFHRLHWEALYDPELKVFLAQHAPLVRRNLVSQSFPANLRSSPTIEVLVVVARPMGIRDVGYRTISRPLIDTLQQMSFPARFTLLRPGTYRALDAHLERITREQGVGYYHIIHFDVHGGLLTYEQLGHQPQTSSYLYRSRFGRGEIIPYEKEKAYLFLESEGENQPDPVEASELACLLQKHKIPIVLLNACQSGKFIKGDEKESSLGSYLIRAGVQSALTMSYSVTVSAAERFMPVLYQELFSTQSLLAALSSARRALANEKERRAYYQQTIELEDWLLPVLYQNQEVRLLFQPFSPQEETAFYRELSRQYQAPQEPSYGFVGRDLDILQVEKKLLLKRRILLVRGMGGAGKTTLLHHMASWWQRTGFISQVFFFGYDKHAWTRQRILRTISQKLLGREAFALFQSRDEEVQQVQLAQHLKGTRCLIVLDNLESITMSSQAIGHRLSKKEQTRLHSFLKAVTQGETMVLLGSRSAESWLAQGTFEDNIHELGGLDPEAASLLTERILERHQVTHAREDSNLQRVIALLDGFPLALEVVLSNLAHQSPTQVLEALQQGGVNLGPGKEEDRTENILQCIDYSYCYLSPEVQQLLLCLAPFTSVLWEQPLKKYVVYLQQQTVLAHLPFEQWKNVIGEAQSWGLLSANSKLPGYFYIQPVFPYFLRRRLASEDQQEQKRAIEVAFAAYYRELSDEFYGLVSGKETQERQVGTVLIQLEYENLRMALDLTLQEAASIGSLYRVLDTYLEMMKDHQRGQELDRLVLQRLENLLSEAHTGTLGIEFLGVLGQAANRQLKLKQYAQATQMYQELLLLLKNISLEEKWRALMQATTLHQLGMVAQTQRAWEEAKSYYQQALQIKVEYDDRYEQASTLHQLGRVAYEQRTWEEAKSYYQQALQIYVEYDKRYEQASTLHNIGGVEQEQGAWEEAKSYYQQALQIYVEYDDRHGQAGTLHQLGIVAYEQGAWEEAKSYYQQALQIKVEYNIRYEQASTLHHLGIVAQGQRAWEEAKNYYQQALQIKVEYNVRYEQASTLHNLGIVAYEQRMWEEAKSYYEQALQIYVEYGDAENSNYPLFRLAELWQATLGRDLLEKTASILSVTSDEVLQLFEMFLQAIEEWDEGGEGYASPHP